MKGTSIFLLGIDCVDFGKQGDSGLTNNGNLAWMNCRYNFRHQFLQSENR